ncbi:major facilitator transporter [Aphanothece sacrum FPU1]|uniref:Major facilitator transporter n=1 Tax=Aphanothece sacrum FPU1 TaxID=1920663 RepID=A0A401IDJ3_APHSA|nr:major facilitator transporter [Aphanothece sacrum FPU1]
MDSIGVLYPTRYILGQQTSSLSTLSQFNCITFLLLEIAPKNNRVKYIKMSQIQAIKSVFLLLIYLIIRIITVNIYLIKLLLI